MSIAYSRLAGLFCKCTARLSIYGLGCKVLETCARNMASENGGVHCQGSILFLGVTSSSL